MDAVIRPEDIDLVKPEDGIIEGVVTHLIFKGVHYEMEVLANNYELSGTQHGYVPGWNRGGNQE
ncbi:MAG: TOBE domain-containing protein [[Clostridium] scindens]